MAIIIKPIITEKVTQLTEKKNCYAFRVSSDANKLQIKQAVEELYGVKVKEVNTVNVAGKRKSRYTKSGIIEGKTASYKKAFVQLNEGEVIDFYSNI